MHKLNLKLTLTAVVVAVFIVGCGGSDDNDGATAPPDIGQNVTALVDFINRVITDNSENSDPIDINALTLAVDDSLEPTPL